MSALSVRLEALFRGFRDPTHARYAAYDFASDWFRGRLTRDGARVAGLAISATRG